MKRRDFLKRMGLATGAVVVAAPVVVSTVKAAGGAPVKGLPAAVRLHAKKLNRFGLPYAEMPESYKGMKIINEELARTDSYDALLQTTLKNYRRTLEDNVFSDIPLQHWLNEKSRKAKTATELSVLTQNARWHQQNAFRNAWNSYQSRDPEVEAKAIREKRIVP